MKERYYNPMKVSYKDYGFTQAHDMVLAAWVGDLDVMVSLGGGSLNRYKVHNVNREDKIFILEDFVTKSHQSVPFDAITYARRILD